MIIVLAKATPKKNMKDMIIKESKDLIKATCEEKGCIEYNLHEPLGDEGTLLFVEKWENKDYLESHLEQNHFINFGLAIEDYLDKDLDISVYSSEEIEL
jgi:quinol monooxygenase YgiN